MPGFFILLPPHLRPGSLVNRASDSGSEGRGFESHPGHYIRKRVSEKGTLHFLCKSPNFPKLGLFNLLQNVYLRTC